MCGAARNLAMREILRSEIVRTWSDSSNVCVAESSGSIARVRRATRDANEKDSKRRRVRRVDAHARRAKNGVIGNRCRLPRRLLHAVYSPPPPPAPSHLSLSPPAIPSILVACSSIDNNGGRVFRICRSTGARDQLTLARNLPIAGGLGSHPRLPADSVASADRVSR